MGNNVSVIAIDAGNTAVKVGLFEKGILKQVQRYSTTDFLLDFSIKNMSNIENIVLSSVLSDNDTEKMKRFFRNVMLVNPNSFSGLQIAYESPHSLGIDRLCNAVASRKLCNTAEAVSIDIGTCIKFDFVSGNSYLGGSISPGIDLRYKSLNDYTAKLPLISERGSAELLGRSTKGAIHSGVINGIQAEIDGLIQKYSADFSDLTFFITGGDSGCFDIEGKNNIFVDENLTLKGLYYIYLANAQ